MRAILMNRLSKEPDIEVVAAAANAAEGRQMIRELDPDVVTLDVEMPGMNGLDFLEKIMQLRPTPVIIVSGATQQGNETTARALALGAVDCYAKSEMGSGMTLEDSGRLANMIRSASKVRFAPRGAPAPAVPASRIATQARLSIADRPRLIAIGSSTGGVEALQILLSDFPVDCPPTLIVQHINERFAPAVARTLDQNCPRASSLPSRTCRCAKAMSISRPAMIAISASAARPTCMPSCGVASRCRGTCHRWTCCFPRWPKSSAPRRWASC
jgi:two-component system chemotaxis response regulator CheB